MEKSIDETIRNKKSCLNKVNDFTSWTCGISPSTFHNLKTQLQYFLSKQSRIILESVI